MQTALKPKIKSEIIAAFIAFWLLATREVDWIVMAIARPYLLARFNNVVKAKFIDIHELYHLLLFTYSYNLIVFQVLVVITALIIFFKKKYQIYKRELLWAYLITVIGKIMIVAIYRYFKLN